MSVTFIKVLRRIWRASFTWNQTLHIAIFILSITINYLRYSSSFRHPVPQVTTLQVIVNVGLDYHSAFVNRDPYRIRNAIESFTKTLETLSIGSCSAAASNSERCSSTFEETHVWSRGSEDASDERPSEARPTPLGRHEHARATAARRAPQRG